MKRIAIVGFGILEPVSVSLELMEAALQSQGMLIVSANEIENLDVKDRIKEVARHLPKEEVYKFHALPLLDEPYIPKHKDSKSFYYNVPKFKRGRR